MKEWRFDVDKTHEKHMWQIFKHYNLISLSQTLHFTLSGLKANIVLFMDVSQHKWIGVGNSWMIWSDDDVTAKTADYTNTSFVAVCCSMEDHVIAPGAIFFHTPQVISP